jgi:hypothetical protein
MKTTHHPLLFVADPSTGTYALADMDKKSNTFVPGNTLIEPESAIRYGFEFPIYAVSPDYSTGKSFRYRPNDEDLQQIGAETLNALKADLEQRINDSNVDAALVDILKSYDGRPAERGSNWIIEGRAILLKSIPVGFYMEQRKA